MNVLKKVDSLKDLDLDASCLNFKHAITKYKPRSYVSSFLRYKNLPKKNNEIIAPQLLQKCYKTD